MNDSKEFQQFIKLQPNEDSIINQVHSSVTYDQDVIILDDDDFIQTTLNFLDKLPKTESTSSSVNNCDDNNAESQVSVLIDLTSDFDLNDLFQMHSNTNVAVTEDFASVEKESVDFKSKQQIIKNEIDFKVIYL